MISASPFRTRRKALETPRKPVEPPQVGNSPLAPPPVEEELPAAREPLLPHPTPAPKSPATAEVPAAPEQQPPQPPLSHQDKVTKPPEEVTEPAPKARENLTAGGRPPPESVEHAVQLAREATEESLPHVADQVSLWGKDPDGVRKLMVLLHDLHPVGPNTPAGRLAEVVEAMLDGVDENMRLTPASYEAAARVLRGEEEEGPQQLMLPVGQELGLDPRDYSRLEDYLADVEAYYEMQHGGRPGEAKLASLRRTAAGEWHGAQPQPDWEAELRKKPHGNKVLDAAQASMSGLPDDKRSEYSATLAKALFRMPARAHEALLKGVGGGTGKYEEWTGFRFSGSRDELIQAFNKVIATFHFDMKPAEEDSSLGGFYMGGSTRGIFLDGLDSRMTAANLDELYAHELAHALDPFREHATDGEWARAVEREIGTTHTGPGKQFLSDYAMVNYREAWAEFGRLLYSYHHVDPKEIEAAFPLCSAYWKRAGFWPEEKPQ